MRLLAATNNEHKLLEISNILAPMGVEVVSPASIGGIEDVEEDGDSFEANAIIKAEAAAKATGMAVIADDSGLEVFALDGEPGIYSARYAGEGASDAQKMAKLLGKLADQDDRSARFVCVIAVATPHGVIGTVEGEVRGRIADAPYGDGGFGYDPLFVPDGHTMSFAQIPADEKDAMSHRGNALQALVSSRLLEDIPAYSMRVDERFLGGLQDGWTWLREVADCWEISDYGLRICATPGTLWGAANNATNVLLRPAPVGDCSVCCEVRNSPTEGGEQAGLIWMADEDNYVKLIKESLRGETLVILAKETEAKGHAPHMLPYPGERVQLKLEKRDNVLHASYRADGNGDWIRVGELLVPQGECQIGLIAHGGPKDCSHRATFSFFTIE